MRKNNPIPFHQLVLALIAGLALFLRFYRLDFESLWLDEMATWTHVSHPTFADVITKNLNEPNPPGYYLLMNLLVRYIGDTEWILRLPSAIAGSFAVLVAYQVGRSFFSWREGLIFSTLCAVLPTMIHYSQEARAYAFVVLLTLLLVFFWIHLLRLLPQLQGGTSLRRLPTEIKSAAIGFSLSALVLLYFHYFGLLLVFTFLLPLFWISLRPWRPAQFHLIFLILIVIGVGYWPWVSHLLQHYRNPPISIAWIEKPHLTIVLNTFQHAFAFSESLYVLSGAGLLMAVFHFWTDEAKFATRKIALWFAVPFALVLLKSYFSYSVFIYRYLLIIWPAFFLLIAKGLTWPGSKRWPVYAVVMLIVVLNLHRLFTSYYLYPQKEPWKQSAQRIEKLILESGPMVLLIPEKRTFAYYLRQVPPETKSKLHIWEIREIPEALKFAKQESIDNIVLLLGSYSRAQLPPDFEIRFETLAADPDIRSLPFYRKLPNEEQ